MTDANDVAKCPVMGGANAGHTATGTTANEHWWPNQLKLRMLHQHSPASNPMDDDFDYAAEFNSLNLADVKKDLAALMTDSQDWWPADYGHYGGLFIRNAWHTAGTYRVEDGRGGAGSGAHRFAPLNSWPDNGNLDKAQALLQPIKQKYGRKISWADLMVLAGNVAMETMGLEMQGFAGGREDIYAPEEDVYWGPENEWLADERYSGDRELANPLGAVQMGLIYVNPEGPNGNPDPVASGRDIRETFKRMAMNDEETVALVAGGHTFGKAHGAGNPDLVGPEPEGAPMQQMGLGWKNDFESGKAEHTTTSGVEGSWNDTPTAWDNNYLETLFKWEWELGSSPAGAQQWHPKEEESRTVPDAHVEGVFHKPMMTTADMALRMDPIYEPIARRFMENFDEFKEAYQRAWFKLTHRDMGPKSRYCGPEIPAEDMIWQDPIPAGTAMSDSDVATLKAAIMDSGLSISDLVTTAWASACTYRDSDKRGGANGARVALAPQVEWDVNNPGELRRVLSALEGARDASGVSASLADTIVLGGAAAVEAAAKAAGYDITVNVSTGRGDATAEMTDEESVGYLEPRADGFRNYAGKSAILSIEAELIDRAQKLTLSAPEMTALVGGMRVLGANYDGSSHGVFTDNVGSLSNDFFVNLCDYNIEWQPTDDTETAFEGRDRASGDVKFTGTRADLVFGANSQLRAIASVYGSSDGGEKFANDFAAAWTKVMELDRFDI